MKFLLVAFLFLSQFTLQAQSAYVRHNTVYANNDEMFKMYSVGTFSHPAYKIKNLQDEDLILIDQTSLRNNQGTQLLKFNFLNMPNAEAYFPLTVNLKKQIAKILVNYNVVSNNKLNADGVALFCKNYDLTNYPSKYIADEKTGDVKKDVKKEVKRENNLSQNTTKNEDANVVKEEIKEQKVETIEDNLEPIKDEELDDNGLVKRDITQPIYLSGSKIRQDYKEIGTFSADDKMLLGQAGKEVIVYGYKGEKVAIARFIQGEEQCELLSIRDNKTWNIPIPNSDIYSTVKVLVKVLSERMYL